MGSDYDFENDKNYNFENSISMLLELGKTCFSPGEYVKGGIILQPKEGNVLKSLDNPNAFLSLTQNSYYTYTVEEMDTYNNRRRYVTREAKEMSPILNIPLNFSNYQNADLNTIIKIPFEFQIPLRIYPSCFFGTKTYVKHFLSLDFPSISAKKSLIIIIKNPPYFSVFNHLYQSPAMCYKEMKKHKIIFSQGSFVASVRLPKNAFKYEEPIPFEIDIDMTKLAISVKYIKISIRRTSNKNIMYDHSKPYKTEKNEIAKKNFTINNPMERKIHITDNIIIEQDKNPINIYRKLDSDNRKADQKFNGIYLYPTCFGGLLSVEYFFKMEIVMDSFWSANEEFLIPIDLFEPFANQPNMTFEQNTVYNNYQPYNTEKPYPYSNSPGQTTMYNNQTYPQQMSQVVHSQPPQQINQYIINNNANNNYNNNANNNNVNNNQDNLPSMNEVMDKTPEDDNPAPPSVLNLNNNNNYPPA